MAARLLAALIPKRPSRPSRAALAAAVALLVAGVPAARAEILSARVKVRGMTCTICSGSVERHLRRLTFVEAATVDLERGLALLVPRGGPRFDGRRLLKAIRGAGYTPGDIEVVARGRITFHDDAAYMEITPGQVALLTGARGGRAAVTEAMAGQVVTVVGRFADPSGDTRAAVAIAVNEVRASPAS